MEKDDKKGMQKVNECCDYAGIKRFTDADFDSLNEYVNVMQPLALSLDLIQGEKEMYLGYLLPVLSTMLKNMEDLRKNKLKYYG